MKKLVTLVCVLFLMTSLSAKIVYVTTDGSNSNAGSSWDKAVADIQTAYTLATAGDEIWMAGGIYVMQDGSGLLVDMKDGVNVYGGFKKGDSSIDARVRPDATNKPYEFTNATIFTSEGVTLKQRPFGRSNTTDEWTGAILDGLVFEGLATENGKLLFLQTGVTMQNCVVKDCASGEIIVYLEGTGLMKDCLVEGCYSAKNDPNKAYAVRLCASNAFMKPNSIKNVTFKGNDCIALHIYNYEKADGRGYVENCTFDGNKNLNLALLVKGANTPVIVRDCVFENNVFATAASTVGEGNVITGNSASLTPIMNCIIRNNKNTSAADADFKNAVISLNATTTRLINCLVYNNESSHLTIWSYGQMVNNTVVNNKGSIVGVGTTDYVNNIFVGNIPTEGKTVFFADSEANVFSTKNAIAANEVTAEGENSDFSDIIEGVDAMSFVKVTSFNGAATNENQLAELSSADFSLVDGSACVNAGDLDYAKSIVGFGLSTEDPQDTEILGYFEKDLAGNDRSTNGKISLGAYQGPKTSAIEDVKADNRKAVVYGIGGAAVVEVENAMNASIYNINGSLVKTVALNAGANNISLANGLYLVKVGNAAYKVVVR